MWKVTIPNMKAAIMVALLFRTLDAFRIFDSVFVMTAGANGTETVSFLAYRQTIARLEIGLGSAVSVLLFLSVVLIAFVLHQGLQGRPVAGDGGTSDVHARAATGGSSPASSSSSTRCSRSPGSSRCRSRRRRTSPTASSCPRCSPGRTTTLIITGDASELFLPALRNSFGICLIATAIACVLSMFAAYAIARLDFPGKRLILSTALAVAIFPVISIVTPLFNLWRQIGLYDTWLGLIIPYLSLTLPISIWTMSAFFREIPWEMEQAAQVDGATTWQAFRKVIVPLAAPGVFTTAIIAFFIAWNDFIYGISLTSTGRPGRSPRHSGCSPVRRSSRTPPGPSPRPR